MQEDAESGLKLMGHRYYDPGSGRFITRDPIGSGTNWYRYADNNPLKNVDPDGLEIRKLTDSEQSQVQTAINDLRAQGEGKAADSLQDRLNHGTIKVDTSEDGTYAETDANDDNIYIHESTFGQGLLGQTIHDPKNPVREAAYVKADRIFFASILFHEWYHTTQGFYWKGWHPNQKESDAWLIQIKFIVDL